MTNILPQEEQKRLRREYLGRVVVVFFLFLSLGEALALALLLPIFIVARQKRDTFESAIVQSDEAAKQFGGEDLTAVLDDTKAKMALLSGRLNRGSSVHSVFSLIAKDTQAGIRISALSYAHGEGGESTVAVDGRAATREDLIAFTKNLQAEKPFTSVHLPITNLALDKDIDFSLSITGHF